MPGVEVLAQAQAEGDDLEPMWSLIGSFAGGVRKGWSMLSDRAIVDICESGPDGRRVMGYDGAVVTGEAGQQVTVGYPRVVLSPGYAGCNASEGQLMYVSDSGVRAYDTTRARGFYATDSAARLAQSAQNYVQTEAQGVFLVCGGVPALFLPSADSFSIRVGGLTFQANTGGMSLAYNSHGFSIEMDGSVHSW